MRFPKRISPTALLLAVIAAGLFVLTAPPLMQFSEAAEAVAEDSSPISQARLTVERWMEEQEIPGLNAAVMADGEILWSEGFGFADLENRLPVWPHTKMRVGSVSKTLTSAAVGLLYEQGKLDLDAPVQRYVPSFPEKRFSITPRQLGGHLAGVRHYSEPPEQSAMFNTRHYDSVVEGLQIFRDDPVLFEPGEKYLYSSHGWNLVSAVVEVASGQDFLSFMQQSVFEPLGMRQTVADHTDRLIANRTRFYDKAPGSGWRNAPYVDNSYKWAGGGFLSTAEDLVRFGEGIVRGRLLEPETVEILWAPQQTNGGESTGYGIGWRTEMDKNDRRRVGHGGGSVGGASRFFIYPEEKLILAITVNLSAASFDWNELSDKVAEAFLK